MANVNAIALHTIHRPGKRKGEQEVVRPNSPFTCPAEEFETLQARGAAKRDTSKAGPASEPTKSSGKGKQTQKAGEQKAESTGEQKAESTGEQKPGEQKSENAGDDGLGV